MYITWQTRFPSLRVLQRPVIWEIKQLHHMCILCVVQNLSFCSGENPHVWPFKRTAPLWSITWWHTSDQSDDLFWSRLLLRISWHVEGEKNKPREDMWLFSASAQLIGSCCCCTDWLYSVSYWGRSAARMSRLLNRKQIWSFLIVYCSKLYIRDPFSLRINLQIWFCRHRCNGQAYIKTIT